MVRDRAENLEEPRTENPSITYRVRMIVEKTMHVRENEVGIGATSRLHNEDF